MTDSEREQLEYGAIRSQLAKMASCLPDELNELQFESLSLLASTCAGEETADRILGYQLAIQQQREDIRELERRLAWALSRFEVEFDLGPGHISHWDVERLLKFLRRDAVGLPDNVKKPTSNLKETLTKVQPEGYCTHQS